MPRSQTSEIGQQLREMVLPDEAPLTDGKLLDRFVTHHDEAALAALVRRHGPMVWGVCSRILRNHHDAEDAFQASFLVLVRRAACVIPREMVVNWLYGVAHQTALKARANIAKRNAKEKQVTEMPEPALVQRDFWSEMQLVLDGELSSLPDKYRVVIILSDLEGKTRKQVARQLGCPEGTVATRLNRARAMLAKRISKHGMALSGGAMAAVLQQNSASACVPTPLLFSTINVVTLLATGQLAKTGAVSAKVAALAEGVLKAMLFIKLRGVAAALIVIIAAFFAANVLSRSALAQRQSDANQNNDVKPPDGPAKKKVVKLKRELDLRSRSDVVAVDLDKRVISGHELGLLGEFEDGFSSDSFRLSGDLWTLSVEPTTEIIIDRRKARLEDLERIVQGLVRSHFITVIGEWEFEALKPRHSNQNGKANRIEVKGRLIRGVVQSMNGNRITIVTTLRTAEGMPGQTISHELANDVQVVINGRAAKVADLKPKMQVWLQMSAYQNAPDVAVTALGPKVEGVIQAVNAEGNTIAVRITRDQLTAEGVPVASHAKVVIDGKEGKLSDLQAGMTVALQMCAEVDKSEVVGITAGNAAKEE